MKKNLIFLYFIVTLLISCQKKQNEIADNKEPLSIYEQESEKAKKTR